MKLTFAGTFSDNGLDGMWSIGGFQLLKPEVRKINEIISYDAACDIVSGLLTDKHVFALGIQQENRSKTE